MKSSRRLPQLRIQLANALNLSFGLSAFALSSLVILSAHGATQTWTGATSASWETTSNWNATTPGASDTALWDTPSSANLSVTLGLPESVLGLKVVNPSGAVTLSGSSLTLGSGGIDMGTATRNLTISSGLTLGGGNQIWNVASGRTLSLDTGTFARTAGATVNIQGSGTVSSTMTGLTSASLTNSILPWATVGIGTSTRFATFSGSNLVGYTGATAETSIASAWGGIPVGGTGLINYDISAVGTAPNTGTLRSVNSIRYSGAGAFTQASNVNISALMTTNAILNAGTGLFTLGAANGFTLNIGIGSTNDLLLDAANAGIVIRDVISGAAGATVTVVGPSTVTLNGASTFTGGTRVNSGTLSVSLLANGGSNSSIGASTSAAGNLSLNGGTLLYTGTAVSTDRLFSLQSSSAIDASGTGAVNFTNTGSMGFNGGTADKTLTLTGTNTGANTLAAVIGDNIGATSVTKSGAGTWVLSGANTFTGATRISAGTLTLSNALALQNSVLDTANSIAGTSAAGLKTTVTTLTMGGLTGNKDLSSVFTTTSGGYSAVTALTLNPGTGVTNAYSGVIADGAAGMTLIKTGLGTQTLSGASTYTGATTVNAGTLIVSGSINGSSVSVNSGGTLGGGGSVKDITLNAGGSLAPGNGIGTLSTATTNGNVVWNGEASGSFAQAKFELSTIDNTSDSLALGTGILDKNTGTVFKFDFQNGGFWDGSNTTTYTLATFGSTDFVASDFSYTNLASGLQGTFVVNSGNLQFQVIPEPSTYAMLLGGLGALVALQRRRRRLA